MTWWDVLKDYDYRSIDLENPGMWPNPIKMISLILAFVVVFGIGAWFFVGGENVRYEQAVKKEKSLRGEFARKQKLAVNFTIYKKQLAEISNRFEKLLLQLPSKSEVPALLEDISKMGLVSGLEFKLFDPLDEVDRDFYKELPINISVTGQYHQLAEFVSRVASLDRIVTLHDMKIGPEVIKQTGKEGKQKPGKAKLQMDLLAKTYRYVKEK